jgi:hypothetical protein
MVEPEDSSGEDFVDGMPEFIAALGAAAIEDAATDLHEELGALRHTDLDPMHYTTCDRPPGDITTSENKPSFRPIAWPRYV